MVRRSLRALAALLVLAFGIASAGDMLSPKPQGAEVAFVSNISKDLNARFPTPADAEKAGYFRYTTEDDTGAISYANLQWQSADPQHPSQLWYSVEGKLLGADYSVADNGGSPPSLWGVNPQRWTVFDAHVHWVIDDGGKMSFGATSVKRFDAAGGNAKAPQPQTVVALGKAKDVAQVKHVFYFPKIWDLIVWVTPNPNGAFAEKNPLVHPSASADKDSM